MSRVVTFTPNADRPGTRQAPWIACGLVALLAAAGLLLLFWRGSAEYHDYRTAPSCNTLPVSADHSDCRYGLSATVTGVHIKHGKGSAFWMTIQGAPPANGDVGFDDETPLLDLAATGDTVHVEVWRGSVVRVDAYGYSDETSAAPLYGWVKALAWLVASVCAALWLLAAGLGRRSWVVQRLQWFRIMVDGGLAAVALIAFLAAILVTVEPSLALLWYPVAAVFAIPSTVVIWRSHYRGPARARVRRTGAGITLSIAILGLLAVGLAVDALVASVQGLASANGHLPDGALGVLTAGLIGAFILLRWCARRRRRSLPWRAIGTPVLEIAVLVLAVVGCVLLGFDVLWGAVPVGLALAALLYGAAVPTLVPRREAALAHTVH